MLDDKLNMKLQFRGRNHHARQRRNNSELLLPRSNTNLQGIPQSRSRLKVTIINNKHLINLIYFSTQGKMQSNLKIFLKYCLLCYLFKQYLRKLFDNEINPNALVSAFTVVIGMSYGNLLILYNVLSILQFGWAM